MTEKTTNKGTREQLETLARWMGWELYEANGRLYAGTPVRVVRLYCREWDPFTDANADYQVLERAREVWLASYEGENDREPWARFRTPIQYGCWYEVGDYARAVLAVLAPNPGKENATHGE